MGIQGIIRPPPEIRAVADKTASFVAKNGRAFETRIVNSAKGKTPKFAFLHESSPFHAYYEDRIMFFTNGGNDKKKETEKEEEVKKKKQEEEEQKEQQKENQQKENQQKNDDVGNDSTKTSTVQDKLTARKATSSVDPVARALLAQRVKINAVLKEAEEGGVGERENQASSSAGRMDTCIPVPVKNEGGDEEEKRITSSDGDISNPQQTATTTSSSTPKEPPTPLPPIFTTILPPKNISPSQLEIIKLTAQFVVLNGKGGPFLRELTVRFWQGHHYPLWGFLQPRHAHYAYFTQLVDLYKKLMQQAVLVHQKHQNEQKRDKNRQENEKEESTKQEEEGNSTSSTLLEIASLKRMVGLEASTSLSASPPISNGDSIAGHDGMEDDNIKILNRINDTAGDVSKCLEHAAYNAEHHRYREEQRRIAQENNGGDVGMANGLHGAARVDWHDFVVVETIDFAVDEVVEVLPPPPPPVPQATKDKVKEETNDNQETETMKRKRHDDDGMDESSDDDEEGIKIVSASEYAPKVVSSQAKFASESRTHVIDPITKKSIPIADMSEHMRIQLLDPKWAKEKQKFMEKQKDSNLVSGDAIARNMNAFAKARTDLFGSSAAEDLPKEVHQNLEASKIMHGQPQMPQPRPAQRAVIPPPPPLTQSVPASAPVSGTGMAPGHPRPIKKARIDEAGSVGHAQVHSTTVLAPVIPQPMAPPTATSLVPPAVAPPVLPITAPTEHTENDTEVLQNLSESDFASSLSDPNVPLSIAVPDDSSYASWGLNGQTIYITVDVMTKVKALKQQLQSQLGGNEKMPVNKMQLKSPTAGFLRKDSLSLAHLNIGPNNALLELVPKSRGGKRK